MSQFTIMFECLGKNAKFPTLLYLDISTIYTLHSGIYISNLKAEVCEDILKWLSHSLSFSTEL